MMPKNRAASIGRNSCKQDPFVVPRGGLVTSPDPLTQGCAKTLRPGLSNHAPFGAENPTVPQPPNHGMPLDEILSAPCDCLLSPSHRELTGRLGNRLLPTSLNKVK